MTKSKEDAYSGRHLPRTALTQMNKKLAFILSLVLTASMLIVLPAGAAEKPAPQPTVTAQQYEQMVRESLGAMAAAYEQRDLRQFMKLVSPDFVGDDFLMYRAVRRDFRYFDNIDLQLNIDGFAVNRKGDAQVAVKYNRSVISNKDGRVYTDRGLTQLTFRVENGQAKLYDMKFPLIFGLSEGLQVASGIVRTAETSNVLVMDRRGNVRVLPFRDAVSATNSNSVSSGTVTLTSNGSSSEGFDFSTLTKTHSLSLIPSGNVGVFYLGELAFQNAYVYYGLPPNSFDTTSAAPDPASVTYNGPPNVVPLFGAITPAPGAVYALQLSTGKFALVEIRSYSVTGLSATVVIRYKYQPSGSRSF